MNFGMTSGFGPNSSVDPTLAQLEVFANEDAGLRGMPGSLAQAALLNFGSGMGSSCGISPCSSIDTSIAHPLDGGFSPRDDALRIPTGRGGNSAHLTNSCATEAWMAAAAARTAGRRRRKLRRWRRRHRRPRRMKRWLLLQPPPQTSTCSGIPKGGARNSKETNI